MLKKGQLMVLKKEKNLKTDSEKMWTEDVPISLMNTRQYQEMNAINMNEIVGTHDILFLCLDTLRYDVAKEEEEKNGTPVLNQYGPWQKRQAPGNFTYPSHHAMFSGFLPCDYGVQNIMEREMLFFPKNIGMGNVKPPNSYCFSGSTFVEGLAADGYETYCIGGVAFFDKRSDIGKVFPQMFQHSYWNPSFGCTAKESTKNQIEYTKKKLEAIPKDQRTFFYINIDAIHYPNYFYLDGEKRDSKKTHAAALRYVDGQLSSLFEAFQKRNKTFVICCSDHGTCYGEDGMVFHGMNHPLVLTVPYKHFILS